MIPSFQKIAFEQKYLSLGGALSGFFGGLSGNQGALRSMFLIKAGISKEEFIRAYFGKELLKKVTFRMIQLLVGVMLIFLGLALSAGLI